MKREPLSIDSPRLVPEWHPTLNGTLTPDQVTAGSQRVTWWACPVGHEWPATISNRVTGSGCPGCARRALPVPAELVAEWHPAWNGNLTPEQTSLGSGMKVWWLCAAGHTWRASLANRGRGSDCPRCVVKQARPLPDHLVAEWHPTANAPLTPGEVTSGSGRKVWWLCTAGHAWIASLANRAKNGSGCPTCWAETRIGRQTRAMPISVAP